MSYLDTPAVSSTQARDQFGELFDRAAHGKERIPVMKRAKPRVAIVPIEDLELLEFLEDFLDLEAARASMAEVRAGAKTIPLDEAARAMGFDPEALRREAKARAAARQSRG